VLEVVVVEDIKKAVDDLKKEVSKIGQSDSLENRISNMAVRYSSKYRVLSLSDKDIGKKLDALEKKLDLNTAMTLLAVAQGLEGKHANKVVQNAKIIGKG
jgi:hypothetical protein